MTVTHNLQVQWRQVQEFVCSNWHKALNIIHMKLECQPIVATPSEHITPVIKMKQEQCKYQMSSTQQIKSELTLKEGTKLGVSPKIPKVNCTQATKVAQLAQLGWTINTLWFDSRSRGRKDISSGWLWDPPGLLSAGDKHQLGCEAPSSAKVKNMWSRISILPIYLHGMRRSGFTFQQHST